MILTRLLRGLLDTLATEAILHDEIDRYYQLPPRIPLCVAGLASPTAR